MAIVCYSNSIKRHHPNRNTSHSRDEKGLFFGVIDEIWYVSRWKSCTKRSQKSLQTICTHLLSDDLSMASLRIYVIFFSASNRMQCTISITFHSLFLLNSFLSYQASIAEQAISLQIHGPCNILIYRLYTTEFLTYLGQYSGSTIFKPAWLDD